ncbi:MAG TPA: hypothetical protein VLS87_06315 [Woeseiaceae bacterium]|nr:hypothetical protein [Woeseiaceae bacterium]
MKKHLAQYLSEFLSITILLLMAIALIAGQAPPLGAGASGGADPVTYQAARTAGDE